MSNNIFDKKSENDYEDSKNDNNEFNTNLENNTKNILLSENYQTIEIKQDLDEDKDEELDEDEDKDEDQDKDEELDEDEDKDEDQDINDVSNTFDDKKDKINECEKYLNKTLNNILDKFIKDTLINGNIEPNKNEYNKNDCDINIDNKNNSNEIFYPISFDLVIENYDTNGNKEIKSISSSNGKITQDDKSINDLMDIKNETDENETNESEFEKIKLNKTKQYYKNKDRNKDKKEISKTNKFISLRKVDYASSIGDIKFLNKWTDSIILSDSYTSEAIDNASANGKIEVLDWWINANKKFGIELKYTEKAINLASKFDKIESLDWWINSGLELKYNHNAIDYASSECKIRILDWWLSKSIKEKLLKFEYTSKSIDNAKLEEQKR